jgi:integrase
MATVWRDMRSRGRPVWCILYKGLDLRWHRERTEAQTKDQAQRLLRARLGEIAEAKAKGVQSLERRKPITFQEFVEKEYMISQAPPVRRQSTHDRDKLLFLNVKETFGPKLLGAITTADIDKYITKRKFGRTCRGTPPSPAQLNRERQFLGSVFSMAKRWGLVDRNVVEDVKKLREDNTKDRVLSPEEETKILDKLPVWLHPIMVVAINTAMRLGEILGLRWPEIERKNGEASLGGFIRIGSESKGHRARHVPMNAAVKAAIDAQRPVATDVGFVPYVFVSRLKRPFSVRWLSNAFAAAAKRAKVEGVSFHTLRHTAVSRMIAAGVPDRIIMKIVGHTTSAMVSRYAHLAPNSLKGATDCLAVQDSTPVVQALGSNRGSL